MDDSMVWMSVSVDREVGRDNKHMLDGDVTKFFRLGQESIYSSRFQLAQQ